MCVAGSFNDRPTFWSANLSIKIPLLTLTFPRLLRFILDRAEDSRAAQKNLEEVIQAEHELISPGFQNNEETSSKKSAQYFKDLQQDKVGCSNATKPPSLKTNIGARQTNEILALHGSL